MKMPFFVLIAPAVLLTLLVPLISWVVARATGAPFASAIFAAIPFVLLLNHSIAFLGLFLVLRREGRSLEAIGWRSPKSGGAVAREAVIGLLASVVLVVVVDHWVRPFLGLGGASNAIADLPRWSAARLAWFAGFLILPAIEESIYRGYGIGRLRVRFGVIPAVLITTFLFGVLHVSAGLREGVSAVALGSLCAAIFLARRDLVAVSVAHSTRNVVAAIGLL